MILFFLVLLLWTATAVGAAAALWRRWASHRKVYWLIALHAVYVAGVFALYAYVRHVPLGSLG